MPTKDAFIKDSLTSSFVLVGAGMIFIQLLALGALPVEPAEPWNKVFHGIAYAALTLLLWIGTDGRWPRLVLGAVVLTAIGDELRQSLNPARSADTLDFAVAALAAGATATLLFAKTGAKKPCAESSAR